MKCRDLGRTDRPLSCAADCSEVGQECQIATFVRHAMFYGVPSPCAEISTAATA